MSQYTIFNQHNYSNIPYPNSGNPSANIETSGCGVCSMAMILANLGGIKITIKDLAKFSLSVGARASSGTNMKMLSKAIVVKYPQLTYITTNSETTLQQHLENGGMAIMNADGNDGAKGIFAAYGHYLTILGVKNGKPVIADPALTTNRYKTAYRRQYVTELGDGLITCAWSTLDLDTKYRTPNYYLFMKSMKQTIIEEEDDEIMYKTINEVPDAYKQTIQDLIDDGDLKGIGKKVNGFPVINVTESFCKAAVVLGRRNPQYDTIEDVPASYRPSVQKLIDKKILKGEAVEEDGTIILNITEDFCKQITINDRTGLYD